MQKIHPQVLAKSLTKEQQVPRGFINKEQLYSLVKQLHDIADNLDNELRGSFELVVKYTDQVKNMKAVKKKTETEIQQLFINRVKLESAIAELRKRTEQIKKENSLQNEHIRRTIHDIDEVNHDIADKQKEAAELQNEANKNLESTNELSLILKRAIKERIQLSKKKEALVDDYQLRLKLNRGGATDDQSFVAIPEQVALFQRKMSLSTN